MALTKDKKHSVVQEVAELLDSSKMTVVATYQGTPVKAMQALRREAKQGGTTVKVVKNRLVMQALKASDNLKDVETNSLTGMLLYAFNSEDEVAAAQALATFAKTQPTLEFVGAISEEGVFVAAEDVKALALLPSKETLRAQLVGTLAAPLSGFVNIMSGNIRGVVQVLQARADSIS